MSREMNGCIHESGKNTRAWCWVDSQFRTLSRPDQWFASVHRFYDRPPRGSFDHCWYPYIDVQGHLLGTCSVPSEIIREQRFDLDEVRHGEWARW